MAMAASTRFVRAVVLLAVGVFAGYVLLLAVFTALFILAPLPTAQWLGYVQTTGEGKVLAAATSFFRPVGTISLGIVKFVSPHSYAAVAQVAIIDLGDVFGLDSGGVLIPQRPVSFPDSALLHVGNSGLVTNLNAEYLQGRKPGTEAGDIALVPPAFPDTALESDSGVIPRLPDTAITDSGFTLLTTCSTGQGLQWNGSEWVCATFLETLPAIGGAGTFGKANQIPVFTTDDQGRVVGVVGTTISGLTAANLAAGDFSSKLTSGTYDIDITGSVETATNFTSSLAGDVTGTQGATVISGLTTANFGSPNISQWTNDSLYVTTEADTLAAVTGRGATTATVLTLSNVANAITAGTLTATGGTINGTTIGATTPSTGAFTTLSSTGTSNIGQGIGVVTLNSSGALNLTGASASTFTTGASTLTLTSSNFNVASGGVVTLKGAQTVDLTTPAATALTIDSGTTGALNFGTGANAKTVAIGNTTGATAVNINSGTGNVNFAVGPTSSSEKVQIGNSGTATPDLLVLDNGTADPTGVAGGMYYNTSTSKFRCFENGAWANCITSSGSDLQHAASYDTDEAVTNIPTGGAQVTLGTVSVTPTTATGDVYVAGWVDAVTSNNTDQPLRIVVETTSNCTGSTVGNASVTYNLTSAASVLYTLGTLRVSGIAVDPGASAQVYSLCAAVTSGEGDSDIRNWGMEAIVIDTGADLAEIYTTNDASVEEGDVVALDASLHTGMQKSQVAYDQTVLGVVSTRPGLLIGGVDTEGVNALPVALSGRVPVKVSAHNGPIKAGDYLTTSTLPGVAMKSTQAGAIIGTAITGFEGEGTGQVLVFVKNGYSGGSSLDSRDEGLRLSPEKASNSASDLADPVKTESVIETSVLSYITKTITDVFKNAVEFLGTVIFHADVTFLGRPTFNNDTAGHALIKAGDNEVTVTFEKEYEYAPVVTASATLASEVGLDPVPGYAVYDLSSKGFKIKLSTVTTFDLTFSWIALSVPQVQELPDSVLITPIVSPLSTILPSATPEATPSPSPAVTEVPASPTPSQSPSPSPDPDLSTGEDVTNL